MNKEYLFLKNLYTLLNAGYTFEEALMICQRIFYLPIIDDMLEELKKGEAIDNVLLSHSLPTLFKEYFYFFKNKNCLSEAIEKTLHICMMRQDYQNQLKSKLTYPLILMTFLFLFSIFVGGILLPNVTQLFDSFQIQKSFMIQIMFTFFYLIPFLIMIAVFLISFLLIRLYYALKKKSYLIIEWYLHLPVFKVCLQKYFSLKFAIYYHELLQEEIDSATIIQLLNDQMTESDLKIVLYEMYNRLHEGEALEDILNDFEYFDPLFLSFFQMYIKNPIQKQSISHYIELTYQQIDVWISQFLKYLVPSIYGFVAIFVITIYVSIIIPMMNVISDI